MKDVVRIPISDYNIVNCLSRNSSSKSKSGRIKPILHFLTRIVEIHMKSPWKDVEFLLSRMGCLCLLFGPLIKTDLLRVLGSISIASGPIKCLRLPSLYRFRATWTRFTANHSRVPWQLSEINAILELHNVLLCKGYKDYCADGRYIKAGNFFCSSVDQSTSTLFAYSFLNI